MLPKPGDVKILMKNDRGSVIRETGKIMKEKFGLHPNANKKETIARILNYIFRDWQQVNLLQFIPIVNIFTFRLFQCFIHFRPQFPTHFKNERSRLKVTARKTKTNCEKIQCNTKSDTKESTSAQNDYMVEYIDEHEENNEASKIIDNENVENNGTSDIIDDEIDHESLIDLTM